jgi:hypothetical protein
MRHWLLQKDARWQIEKISEKRMILTWHYESISMSQTWTLFCKDGDALEISIGMEVNEPVCLTHQCVRLELQDKYKNWITVYEQGDFLVRQYINNIAPIRLKDNKVPAVVLTPEDKEVYPKLLFEASSHLDRRTISIYKKKEIDEECICIDSALIISKKGGLVKPGKYTYFEGRILLDKKMDLRGEAKTQGVISLSNGDLKFIFDRGKGRVLSRQKELTTGLGVYSSVRSSGVWYDSYQALWEIIEVGKDRIVAVGDWPHIPISQTWQIELMGRDLIFWKVDIEIYEEASLEIEQANLMLSREYKTWVIPPRVKGKFLDEYTQDYDILPFRFWYGRAPRAGIGAIDKNLPGIFLECNLKDNRYRAIIENTDSLYRGRLLQYQKSNADKISPQKYTYFEGVIRVGP